MAQGKVTIFTGAPRPEDLDWSEKGLLSNHTAAFGRFVDFPSGYEKLNPTPEVATQSFAKWRVVEQDEEVDDVDWLEKEEDVTVLQDSEECDHSLFVYENTQLHDLTSLHHEENTISHDDGDRVLDDSYLSLAQDESNTLQTQPSIINLPPDLIRLKALPTAPTIDRLYPQTITINLIVTVINKSLARTILTKKDNREMILTELTVIDESATPFDVTFWLRPRSQRPSSDDESQLKKHARQTIKVQDELRRQLDQVRNRDVILLRNVALSAFRGKVKGQTLHPAAKARTSIIILGRDAIVQRGRLRGSGFTLERADRVVEYARGYLPSRMGYVKAQRRSSGAGGYDETEDNEDQPSMLLPPDTPV